MIDPKATVPPELLNDPVGAYYVDKMIGKCPICDAGLRAHGIDTKSCGVKTGVTISCTNHLCQAEWKN